MKSKVMINLKTKNYVKPILFIVSILTLAGCRQISVSNINNDYVIDQDSGKAGAEQKAPEYPAQNILVRGNTMRNNPYGGLWVGGYSDDAGFVTDVIVTRNTFQKNGTVEDGFYGEIYQTNVTNLKLSDNTFQ